LGGFSRIEEEVWQNDSQELSAFRHDSERWKLLVRENPPDPHCKRSKFLQLAQILVNASALKRADRKIDDKKISGDCSEMSSFCHQSFCQQNPEDRWIDGAASGITCAEREFFTPQFITRL